MTGRLQGKVAIVTGGGMGFGRGIAQVSQITYFMFPIIEDFLVFSLNLLSQGHPE